MIIRPSVEPAADWSSQSPLRDLQDVPDHRQHGRRVDEERGHLLVGDVGGHRPGLPARGSTAYSAQFPPAWLMTATRFPVTSRPSRPGPASSTTPTPSKPGVAGRVGQHAVPAADDQQVGRIDRAGDHPDPDLARPRLGLGDVADLEHLGGLAELFEDGSPSSRICVSVGRVGPGSRTGRSGYPNRDAVEPTRIRRTRQELPTMPTDDPLVTTDWLEDHLGDPDVRVVDIRGYVTTRPGRARRRGGDYRGAPDEYRAGAHPRRRLRRLDARHRRPRRPRPGPDRRARTGSPRRWPSAGSATRPT